MSNNFEQMSLADFFGTDELGFTPATKKETPKAAPKTSAPKAEPKAKAPVKETKYTLPLKVVSGYANFDLEGEGEVTLAQLKELIFAKAKFLAPAITKVDAFNAMAAKFLDTYENQRQDDFSAGSVITIPCGAKTLTIDWGKEVDDERLMSWK